MEARTTGKREFYANYKMCSAWRFLYKRSMVVANGILFPAIGEDTMFNCEFLFYAKSAFVMDNILYTYYVKESVALLSSLKKRVSPKTRLRFMLVSCKRCIFVA